MNLLGAIAVTAVGGALGSVARYLVTMLVVSRLGPGFPWGTFAINVTGSFAIGVVLQLAVTRADFSPYLRLFLTTGILGGYTTFSAFAFETYGLAADGFAVRSIAYAVGSVLVGVAAAYAGVVLVSRSVP